MARKRKSSTKNQNPLEGMPSASTLFRLKNLDTQTRQLVRTATDKLKPLLWIRDGGNVRKIEAARSPEELIELLPYAKGLANDAWFDRMGAFGNEVFPLIVDGLKGAREIKDEALQDLVYENLILALRWRGLEGGGILADCFEELNDYGKSLASVVFGLVGARSSADRIWQFYQQASKNRQESYFVGALWGLIDLQDGRAAGALANLLEKRRFFNELFGFVSLAGDHRAVKPLLEIGTRLPEDERMDSMMAMIGVAHRIGREALAAEIQKAAAGDASIVDPHSLADVVLSQPLAYAQEYFESFYRGFSQDDAARVLAKM